MAQFLRAKKSWIPSFLVGVPSVRWRCRGGFMPSRRPHAGGFETRPYVADKLMGKEKPSKHGIHPGVTEALLGVTKMA